MGTDYTNDPRPSPTDTVREYDYDLSLRDVDTAEAIDAAALRKLTTKEAISEFLQERWNEDVLDDLVHDAKSEEAAELNNNGIDAQIAYLADDNPAELARALADRLYGQ
jgi:hypothetical protein